MITRNHRQPNPRQTPETALVTLGYGFADQHINRLILQALPSNPTLQVLIVDPRGVLERRSGQPGQYDFETGPVSGLAQVADQRLAVLTGDDACFAKLAAGLMPDPDDFALDDSATLASALADAIGPKAPTGVEAEAGS